MPADSILVATAVVAMFLAFAGALFWADLQTPPRQQSAGAAAKRHPL